MLLAEELLLIVLDDETGELQYNPGVDYGKLLFYAFPTAILMDLVLLNRISIKDNKIYIIDSVPTNDDLLDKTLNIIENQPVNCTIPELVAIILGKIPNLQELISHRLVDQKILKIEGNKFMKKLRLIRYPLEKPEIKYELMQKVTQTLKSDDKSDPHMLYLIGILLSLHILEPIATDFADHLLRTTGTIDDFFNLSTAIHRAFLSNFE